MFLRAQSNLFARVNNSIGKIGELREVDAVAIVRTLDQGIASRHHAHLRYPPQLLVLALMRYLNGASEERAIADALGGASLGSVDLEEVGRLAGEFQSDLSNIPFMLETVVDGLDKAIRLGFEMILVTEGRLDKQRRILDHHKIRQSFVLELELTKSVDQFRRVVQRFQGRVIYMIGDQLDRDVLPAQNAGIRSIYVESGFVPGWNEKLGSAIQYRRAPSFLDAINLIEAETA